MEELTFKELAFLAGYTEEQANALGLSRSELISLTLKIAA